MIDDRQVTVEERLPGTTLARDLPGARRRLDDQQLDALVEVLVGLAGTADVTACHDLPVLDEQAPPWPRGTPFAVGLANLVLRRVSRFDQVLRAAMPDIDMVTGAVVTTLHAQPTRRAGLVHGDLIPANILVDARLRPTAVIDLGFLTTAGDPMFDAALTASFTDMYSADARANEARIQAAITRSLPFDATAFAVYRAGYALITACAYGSDGSDGHFAWCVRMVRRPEVRDEIHV